MKWATLILLLSITLASAGQLPEKGWVIEGGINQLDIKIRNTSNGYPWSFLNNIRYKKVYSPTLIIGHEIPLNNHPRLVFFPSLGANPFRSTGIMAWKDTGGRQQTETYNINSITFGLGFAPTYRVWNHGHTQLFLGFGANANVPIYFKNEWTTTESSKRPIYPIEDASWLQAYGLAKAWLTKNLGVTARVAPYQSFSRSARTRFYQSHFVFTLQYGFNKSYL